ncbi:MAG TPA: cupin domain-containing protein [Ilumatobacteraceae bacterium]
MSAHDGFAYLRTTGFDAMMPIADSGKMAVNHVVNGDSGSTRCMVTAFIHAPGQSSPAGFHRHEFDKVMYVVEGTESVQIEDETFEAKAGDVVFFPAGVAHRNWNASDGYVKLMSFITPLPDPAKPLSNPVAAQASAPASGSDC